MTVKHTQAAEFKIMLGPRPTIVALSAIMTPTTLQSITKPATENMIAPLLSNRKKDHKQVQIPNTPATSKKQAAKEEIDRLNVRRKSKKVRNVKNKLETRTIIKHILLHSSMQQQMKVATNRLIDLSASLMLTLVLKIHIERRWERTMAIKFQNTKIQLTTPMRLLIQLVVVLYLTSKIAQPKV